MTCRAPPATRGGCTLAPTMTNEAMLVVLPEAAWSEAFVETRRVAKIRLPSGGEVERSVKVMSGPSAALPEMLRSAPQRAAPRPLVDAVLYDPDTATPLCVLPTGEVIHSVLFHHIEAVGGLEDFCYGSLGDELPMVWLVLRPA